MKPKETQILGLLITALISLIVFDLYTIYCITSYIKLTSLDVTTSFAVIDALFYQSIKLIILSYGIFALVVEIRGIYILRNRRNSKLITKMQRGQDRRPSEPVKHEHSYTLQDVLNEAQSIEDEFKVQEEASNLKFISNLPEFKTTDEVIKRYGFNGYMALNAKERTVLTSTILEDKFHSLRVMNQYYHEFINKTDKQEMECWNNVQHDLELVDIELNTK